MAAKWSGAYATWWLGARFLSLSSLETARRCSPTGAAAGARDGELFTKRETASLLSRTTTVQVGRAAQRERWGRCRALQGLPLPCVAALLSGGLACPPAINRGGSRRAASPAPALASIHARDNKRCPAHSARHRLPCPARLYIYAGAPAQQATIKAGSKREEGLGLNERERERD